MIRTLRVAWLAAAATLSAATPAAARGFMLPWFNGFGVSAGGGPLTVRGEDDDPLVAFIRPDDDTHGAAALGFHLTLGGRRRALLLPEVHYADPSLDTAPANGAITLGPRTVTFEADTQPLSTVAVLTGADIDEAAG